MKSDHRFDKSPAAIRMQRHRKRQRDGVQVVPVQINQDMIESLLFSRHLTREEAGNPLAIAKAVERLMKK